MGGDFFSNSTMVFDPTQRGEEPDMAYCQMLLEAHLPLPADQVPWQPWNPQQERSHRVERSSRICGQAGNQGWEMKVWRMTKNFWDSQDQR
ncbi:uncharacterized protein ACWYII_014770 isoform 3-T8 [Salvelinus alpinus]